MAEGANSYSSPLVALTRPVMVRGLYVVMRAVLTFHTGPCAAPALRATERTPGEFVWPSGRAVITAVLIWRAA
jgi:hypothetical protein